MCKILRGVVSDGMVAGAVTRITAEDVAEGIFTEGNEGHEDGVRVGMIQRVRRKIGVVGFI